jgi:uncharacterized membrane protein
MTQSTENKVIHAGRIFYGLGIVGLGIQHFVIATYVPVILPSLPGWLPFQGAWPYAVGLFLIAAGTAIVCGQGARRASVVLGTALLAALVLRGIPVQFAAGRWPIASWNYEFKLLTLSGGAFVVASSLPDRASAGKDTLFRSFGCFALAITVAVFGGEHFQYVSGVADLVPSWIPGHIFWTYWSGSALIAAGLGMLLRIQARLAAGLLGTIIFIWFLVLHIPRALADPHSGNGNEWSSVFESLAFSGIAFILSLTLPKKSG